jgi:threonine dehydratase
VAAEIPTRSEIEGAGRRLEGKVVRTPLVRLGAGDDETEIYLKLENLQPIGSFKLRGACNAMESAPASLLDRGVYTASAGNMAQGVAWNARQLDIPCAVVVPDHAPQAKIDAIVRLGAEVIPVPFAEWWQVIVDSRYEGLEGLFVHPVKDRAVMAGNGTIGLEIIEDLPDVGSLVIPFGGGGLSCGIAAALETLGSKARIYAAEVETAAPLAAAFAADRPVQIDYVASFVDGIGSGGVLDDMWPLARRLIDESLVVTLGEIEEAIRILAGRNQVVAEGAGAASVAAALSGRAGPGPVVCVVSGGNIDLSTLATILTS